MTNIETIGKKILAWDDVQELMTSIRESDKKIVFTNGCFDILHYGHVNYLAQAAELGDILFIGVNSDASTKRLKGPTRPINKELDRAALLAGLFFVDFLCVFEGDTPLDLIKNVNPHVLVKGGDYSIDQIVGADFVTAQGGRVTTIPFVDGYSTTNTIKKSQK